MESALLGVVVDSSVLIRQMLDRLEKER